MFYLIKLAVSAFKFKHVLFLLFTLLISFSSLGQERIASDSMIKRAVTKLVQLNLSADYKTGSAFSLIHFKSSNGRSEIIDYKSSNTEFQKALKTLFDATRFDLQLTLPKDKNYLAIIIYTAENMQSEELYFNNNTFYSMRSLSEIKLHENTVVLPPIWIFTTSPIR